MSSFTLEFFLYLDFFTDLSDIIKAFVAYDPAGYYIEFDQFLEDRKNQRILKLLR